jgi:hypothetical protein
MYAREFDSNHRKIASASITDEISLLLAFNKKEFLSC